MPHLLISLIPHLLTPADTSQGPPPLKKMGRQAAADEALKKVQLQQQTTRDKLAEMLKRADATDCHQRT